MAFLPLLMKELYRCGLVVTASFVGAGCRVRLKPYGTRWLTGGEVKGKLENGVCSQYPHTTSEPGVSSITNADAHTSAASSRLKWRPRRFKWTRPFRWKTKSGFCACAIRFQTHYTTRRWGWLLGRRGYSVTHHYPLYPYVTYYNKLLATNFLLCMKVHSFTGLSSATLNVNSHMPCRAPAVLCRDLGKSLSERRGRSTAGARHGMCELAYTGTVQW